MPITGDLSKELRKGLGEHVYASAFPYTRVPMQQIEDPSSPINQTYLSGKRKGAGVVGEGSDGSLVLLIASGGNPEDPWYKGASSGAPGDILVPSHTKILVQSIFGAGQAGALYVTQPVVDGYQMLYIDEGMTVPVTADGDPIGRMIDLSGNWNSAVQSISAARPTYNTSPDRLSLDKVDDALIVTVPAGGWTGTMVLATDQGTASYGVSIDAGAYDLGGEYFPGDAIVAALFRDGEMTTKEKADVESYFVWSGATESYRESTDFGYAWRNNSLTSFPLIDTSSGTNFKAAWSINSLTSFPLIDTSSGTSFKAAWSGNSLTSFPLIDTSSGTNFRSAWRDNSLTSFPLIDTSSGTDFGYAWSGNAELVDFPANFFDNIKGGNLDRAFDATNLNEASIDGILVSLVTSGIAAGTRLFDQSGGSAPSSTGEAAIDTLRSRGWTVEVTGGY